jgi:hypothetical protein
MTRFAKPVFMAALAGFFCLAQGANAAQASQTPAPGSQSQTAAPANSDKAHGAIPAELTKSLDSKKLKVGDPVAARITTDIRMRDERRIPRGSLLTGHVTEAKARSKGDPQAALGVLFDKITTPSGTDMAVKGVFQALGPSLSPSPQMDTTPGPGMMAGHEGGGTGTTPPPMPNPSQIPPASRPVLNAQSKGVVGIPKLELGENSVLTTSGNEVKLDSGTQIIVQVEIE